MYVHTPRFEWFFCIWRRFAEQNSQRESKAFEVSAPSGTSLPRLFASPKASQTYRYRDPGS